MISMSHKAFKFLNATSLLVFSKCILAMKNNILHIPIWLEKHENPPCFTIFKKLVALGVQQVNNLLKLHKCFKAMNLKNTNSNKIPSSWCIKSNSN